MRRPGSVDLLSWVVAAAAAGWWAPPVRAAEAPELKVLFPRQAEISVEGEGLARLELPPEVIRELRADLSDLRILDRQGREVPYLLDAGLPRETRVGVRQEVEGRVLEVRREILEREGAPNVHRETYEVTVPAVEPRTGNWDLVFASRRRSFVRRVRIEALDADGASSPLLAGTTVFRLPDPLRQKTRLALPALPPGTARLRLELEGEDGSFLEPVVSYESSRTFDPRDRAAVELQEIGRHTVDRRTVVEVERPQGLTPDLLLLETATPAFRRTVEVWDEGPGSDDRTLGEGTVFRAAGLGPSEERGAVEETEISLRPARGDRLRVIVADGDSPPLRDLKVLAVVRRPSLVFSLPAEESGEAAGTLLFGGGRAYRPQYDLEPLLPALGRRVEGKAAEVAELLADPGLLAAARLGEVRENPSYDASPVLAFAHRPGASLDVAAYRFRRKLLAEPSSEGLVRLRLGIEDLHRARPDLADLRIADPEGRQWAYLLERAGARETRAVPVEHAVTEEGETTYTFTLPEETVELSRLTLDFPEAFFDRAFRLEGTSGEKTVQLARGRLRRRIGDPRPVLVSFPTQRVDSLTLTVEDGDDAPLDLRQAQVRLPVADLYFAAPAGEYELLLGEPEADRPRYELARVRQVVLAVAAGEAGKGPLEENPAFASWKRLGTKKGAQQLLLWVALAAAIVLLTLMTLRLARKESG